MNDHPWHLRHNFDRVVKESVVDRNEYALPNDMQDWCVLDVGGHIGCFARACAERGAIVVSYEPNRANCAQFRANTAHLENVHLIEAAVVDSWKAPMPLGISLDPAGHSLFRARPGDPYVDVVAFAAAVWGVAMAGDKGIVDLVKIDAEGAEYPILENCPLDGVRRLTVEFHDNYVPRARGRAQACRERLAMLGFRELAWEITHPECGWYRLYRGER